MQNVAREYGSKDSSTVPDLVGPKEGAGVGSQPFNGGKEETAHATDWRRLFAASPDQTMKYFPPQLLDGKIVIPVEVIDEGASQWQNSVVAQFIGIVPNFSLFQRLANVMWGGDGKVIVKPAGANLFIIQFPNSTARDRVLESGPWHVQNKPLIIRRWEPGLKRLEFNMKKLPLWLHLGNVPLELFTNRGLSYIASTLGNPLYMDRITARQERLSYAKICVEIEASMDIPRTIDIVMGNGSTVSISVEVPWYPHRCSRCCMFGHNDKSCPSKPIEASVEVVTKVWKPKQVDAGNIRLGEPQKQKETAVEATVITKAAEVLVRNSPLPLRSSSTNRFAILDAGMDMALKNDLCCQDNVMESREEVTEPRKVRTASAGVAELMKSLKPKKKGPIDKGKPKQNKTGFSVLGGQPSSSSSSSL